MEVGHHFELVNGNGILVPQAQLILSSVSSNPFTDTIGNVVNMGENTSAIARLGLAYSLQNEENDIYVIGNVLYNFSETNNIEVEGAIVSSAESNAWVELGVGGSHKINDTIFLYGEITYRTSLRSRDQNNNMLSATAGLSLNW